MEGFFNLEVNLSPQLWKSGSQDTREGKGTVFEV